MLEWKCFLWKITRTKCRKQLLLVAFQRNTLLVVHTQPQTYGWKQKSHTPVQGMLNASNLVFFVLPFPLQACPRASRKVHLLCRQHRWIYWEAKARASAVPRKVSREMGEKVEGRVITLGHFHTSGEILGEVVLNPLCFPEAWLRKCNGWAPPNNLKFGFSPCFKLLDWKIELLVTSVSLLCSVCTYVCSFSWDTTESCHCQPLLLFASVTVLGGSSWTLSLLLIPPYTSGSFCAPNSPWVLGVPNPW